MKSSLSIWRYVVFVKSTVKISSIFVAFLENINFNHNNVMTWNQAWKLKSVSILTLIMMIQFTNPIFIFSGEQ